MTIFIFPVTSLRRNFINLPKIIIAGIVFFCIQIHLTFNGAAVKRFMTVLSVIIALHKKSI